MNISSRTVPPPHVESQERVYEAEGVHASYKMSYHHIGIWQVSLPDNGGSFSSCTIPWAALTEPIASELREFVNAVEAQMAEQPAA